MKIWLDIPLFLLLLKISWTESQNQIEQNHEFNQKDFIARDGSFDISKITGWTSTDNVASFTVTVLASQLIVAAGWLIFGKVSIFMKGQSEDSRRTVGGQSKESLRTVCGQSEDSLRTV